MKKLYYLVGIIVLTACGGFDPYEQSGGNQGNNTTQEIVEDEELVQLLTNHKYQIDKAINDKLLIAEVLVKVAGSNKLLHVPNEDWPPNIQIAYNVWRDRLGTVRLIAETPISTTQMVNLVYDHYFNEDGTTFALVKTAQTFQSKCVAEGTVEKNMTLYNDKFQIIKIVDVVTDEEGNILDDQCSSNYQHRYPVSPTLEAYFERIRYPKKEEN